MRALALGDGVRREAGELHGAAIVDEANALAVTARVGQIVRENDVPVRPEVAQHLAKLTQVVPQLDDGDQIEDAKNFGYVMQRRSAPRPAPKLPDVPRGNIQGLVEARGRDVGRFHAALEFEEALGDGLGELAVVHGTAYRAGEEFGCVQCAVLIEQSLRRWTRRRLWPTIVAKSRA
ncbi:MAG: hypothetical protein AB7K71_40415 [Polyangiaceae bacterium]